MEFYRHQSLSPESEKEIVLKKNKILRGSLVKYFGFNRIVSMMIILGMAIYVIKEIEQHHFLIEQDHKYTYLIKDLGEVSSVLDVYQTGVYLQMQSPNSLFLEKPISESLNDIREELDTRVYQMAKVSILF
jgi:hypothetical protein